MSKILKNFFTLILSGILIGGIAVFAILWVFSNKLPDYKFLKNYKDLVFIGLEEEYEDVNRLFLFLR